LNLNSRRKLYITKFQNETSQNTKSWLFFSNLGRYYLVLQGKKAAILGSYSGTVYKINTKEWNISTSQSKSTDAADLSRDCTSEFLNSLPASPDKLFKNVMVSVKPCRSP
jgi:hypothetical protein